MAPVTGAFTVSWEHRNKLLGLALSQDATGVQPEPGVTYTIKVYNNDTNALLLTKTNIGSSPAQVNVASSLNLRVELFSVNGAGLASRYAQKAVFAYTTAGGSSTIEGGNGTPAEPWQMFAAVDTIALSNITLSGLADDQRVRGVDRSSRAGGRADRQETQRPLHRAERDVGACVRC